LEGELSSLDLPESVFEFADTHCHLDFPFFEDCLASILAACRRKSINMMVVPSVDRASWGAVQRISVFEGIYPAYGLHPLFIKGHDEADILALECQLQEAPEVVALGEIGLDSTAGLDDRQSHFFEAQLEMASRFYLPVIIHARGRHSQVLACLKKYDLVGGVLHAYSGSFEQLMQYVHLGFKIGVGGVITWPRSNKSRVAIAKAPLSSLVLETDSPDMGVYLDDKKHDSTPLHVINIFKVLCQIRSESPEEIASSLWNNSVSLFLNRQNIKKIK
jgi:TatD DNase family protein